MADALQKDFPQAHLQLLALDRVGPSVGRQIELTAIKASLRSMLGILLYPAFRYEFSFAIGAVLAIIQDVLMALGCFFLSGRQLSVPIVAAVLTIIGFSTNDTVVIFDRIREDLRLGVSGTFEEVIDHSKYLHHIGEPDAARRLIAVQPGAINEQVNKKAGPHGFIFGPDPSSHAYCTIGGNIGNNSCGIHSVESQMYGPGPRASDNVHSMGVVTFDGERFRAGVGKESDLERIIGQGGRKGKIYRELLPRTS
jgi:hypothetical protein